MWEFSSQSSVIVEDSAYSDYRSDSSGADATVRRVNSSLTPVSVLDKLYGISAISVEKPEIPSYYTFAHPLQNVQCKTLRIISKICVNNQ